jgi:hypothetical protein
MKERRRKAAGRGQDYTILAAVPHGELRTEALTYVDPWEKVCRYAIRPTFIPHSAADFGALINNNARDKHSLCIFFSSTSVCFFIFPPLNELGKISDYSLPWFSRIALLACCPDNKTYRHTQKRARMSVGRSQNCLGPFGWTFHLNSGIKGETSDAAPGFLLIFSLSSTAGRADKVRSNMQNTSGIQTERDPDRKKSKKKKGKKNRE